MSATVGTFFEGFGDGATVLAVAASTLGVWLFHYLIARGVRDAAIVNRIVTVFKIIPILVFIVVLFANFDAGVFADNWTAEGYGDLGNLDEQVRNTMLITTFVFIGIEASVYSRYARRREDVGKATVLGSSSRSWAVGAKCHQCRGHRVGARRLPRLDVDGRRGHVHPCPPGRFPTVPRSGERRRNADHRAGRHLARRAGAAGPHPVRERRIELHARPVDEPRDPAVPPRGGLRAQARADRRDVRRGHGPDQAQGDDPRRRGHGVHDLPLRRGGAEVRAADDGDPRSGHAALHQGPQRLEPPVVHTRRDRAVRADPRGCRLGSIGLWTSRIVI